MGGAGGAADGRHFNHDNPNRAAGPSAPMPGAFGSDGSGSGRREPVFLGGSGLAGLGRAQGWAPGPPPPRPGAPREDADPSDLPPELLALRQMFTNIVGPGAAGMLDMFGGALMGMGGRAGDYVWGQQGLDDVISDLMNQTSGSSAPPPADEEAIGKLEKRSRRQPETLSKYPSTSAPCILADARGAASARNRECPTCMEVFVPEASSSRSASPTPKASEPSDDDPPEVVPSDEDTQQDDLLLSAFCLARRFCRCNAHLTRALSAVPAPLPRRLSGALAEAQRHMSGVPPLHCWQDLACSVRRRCSGCRRIRQSLLQHSGSRAAQCRHARWQWRDGRGHG